MQISEIYNSFRSKLTGFLVGSNTSPLSLSDIESIYGSSQDFIRAYQLFEEEYINEVVRSNAGRNVPVTDVRSDLASKGIDFSLIKDYKARKRLEEKFKRQILKLTGSSDSQGVFSPGLLDRGLPTVTTPSSNPFRATFRYLFDNEGEQGFLHPAQVLLTRLNMTFNPSGPVGLESIGIGGKIFSSSQIASATGMGGTIPRPVAGELRRVMTLDIETTGVDAASLARTIALSESYINEAGDIVDASGNPAGPRLLSNVFLDIQSMHGQTVTTSSGATQSMSDFLIEREITSAGLGGSDVGVVARTDSEMLDALEGLLRQMNEADTVVTYNARFDIPKLLQTISDIEGSQQHEGLMQQLNIFNQKMTQSDFISDQLISASNYLQQQAIEIARDEGAFDDPETASARIQRLLYNVDPDMPSARGKATTYASVGDIAQNTNLLDLVRRDAPEVFNEIHSGSHIASVDVLIEDYIRKYMDNGELLLDEFERKGIQEGSVDAAQSYLNDSEILKARNIIRRSKAINATTDIADVGLMSDTVFRSVRENPKFLQDVSVEAAFVSPAVQTPTGKWRDPVTGQFVSRPSSPIVGTLAYDKEAGEYKLYDAVVTGGSDTPRTYTMSEIDDIFGAGTTQDIESYITQTLDDARAGVSSAQSAIVSTGINYGTASKIDAIDRLGLVGIGRQARDLSVTPASDEDILSAFGSVFEVFGQRRKALPGFGFIKAPVHFRAGFGRYTDTQASQVSEKFARIGYGYFSDPEERVVSTVLARNTARLGQNAATQSVMSASSAAAANPPRVSYAARATDLVEMGLSYFKAGGKENIANLIGESGRLSDKLIIPLAAVEEAVGRVQGPVSDTLLEKTTLGGARSLDDIGFSFGNVTKIMDDGTEAMEYGVNVVWNTGRNLSQEESIALAEQLVDMFSDADDVKKVLGIQVDEEMSRRLSGAVGQIEGAVSSTGRDEAVQEVARRMREGIVIGSLDITEDEAMQMAADFKRIGIDTSTDVISGSLSSRILSSNVGEVTDQGQRVGVLAPVRNYEVTERLGDEATQLVRDTDERYLASVGHIAERLDESTELAGQVSTKVSKAVNGSESYILSQYYSKYKKQIFTGIGAAAIAAAGYYGYKKYQERSTYDETIEQQPYEDRMNKYSLGEVQSLSSGSRLDPMGTTPLVNDLNNRRINHTNMSNRKNDHLFSGAI